MSEDNEGSVEIDMEGNEDDTESNGSSRVDEEKQADNESVGGGSTVVPPSANSGKSGLSRKGSAKSQKSVAWSTGASSEKELISEIDKTKKGPNKILGLISGIL